MAQETAILSLGGQPMQRSKRVTFSLAQAYRCHGLMDARGRWRAWRFGPAADEQERHVALAATAGQVLFASVQTFAPPRGVTGTTLWRQVRDQYIGQDALPHVAPLYFDIDCDGDLDRALLGARELVTFFTQELRLAGQAVRVWFSGSKGTHVLVDATSLAIQPSPTLTADMKAVALDLVKHLASLGAPTMNVDPAVYSLPRMLRLPDQVNPRSGLYKVELSHRELFGCSTDQITAMAAGPRGPCWSIDDLPTAPIPAASAWWASVLARANQPRTFRIKTAQVAGLKVRPDGFVADELTTPTMPSCIKGVLGATSLPGGRNRCELQIACWAKGTKLPYTKALALLSTWTNRNRPELAADNAQRKAESILRSVYGQTSYGFSCAAARSVAQSVGCEPACGDCQVVRPHHTRQVHSLRVRHDEQWSPASPITLEQARGLVAAAIDERVAAAGHSQPGGRAAGRRQNARGDASAGQARHAGGLCHAHA